jgi:hypothetical protein
MARPACHRALGPALAWWGLQLSADTATCLGPGDLLGLAPVSWNKRIGTLPVAWLKAFAWSHLRGRPSPQAAGKDRRRKQSGQPRRGSQADGGWRMAKGGTKQLEQELLSRMKLITKSNN